MVILRAALAALLIFGGPALAQQPSGGLQPLPGAPRGQIPGTVTNDNAAAGKVGEVIQSTYIPCTTATGLTSASYNLVTSISLTAGDWDVEGALGIDTGSGTSLSYLNGYIEAAGVTLALGQLGYIQPLGGQSGSSQVIYPIPKQRISLASTTAVQMAIGYMLFSGGTAGACGQMIARRVR